MDSCSLTFKLKAMSREEYSEANYPFDVMSSIDQDGVMGGHFSRWITAKSPLTGAGYKVRAMVCRDADHRLRVVAYNVEVNAPACLIGNNYLLENRVHPAIRGVRRLLQYWLLQRGCSPSGITAISLQQAELGSVTLTYLIKCADTEDAKIALRELATTAEGLHNKRYRTKPLSMAQAYGVGSDESATVYCKHRLFTIVAYVKDGSIKGAFSKFASVSDEQAVLAQAGRYLRVEIELHGEWLRDSGRSTPEAWRCAGDNNPYDLPFDLIRGFLRLDDNLRTRRPQPVHLASLSLDDQEILAWHLKGLQASEHPLLSGKDRTKYYPIRARILKKTRIDISVPWRVQNNDLSPRLNRLLRNPGRYRSPKRLAPMVFSRETANAAIRNLDQLIHNTIRTQRDRERAKAVMDSDDTKIADSDSPKNLAPMMLKSQAHTSSPESQS